MNDITEWDVWMAEVIRLTEVLDEEHWWDFRKEKWIDSFERGDTPQWIVETRIEIRNMQ